MKNLKKSLPEFTQYLKATFFVFEHFMIQKHFFYVKIFIRFSERKIFANRKCLSVCPTNQIATILIKNETSDFPSQTEWQ